MIHGSFRFNLCFKMQWHIYIGLYLAVTSGDWQLKSSQHVNDGTNFHGI